MANSIDLKIKELADAHGYDTAILRSFADFVLKQTEQRPSKKKKESDLKQLKLAVIAAFGCVDYRSLKKHKAFKLATDGRGFDFRKKATWLTLYREWIGVPENEQNEAGPTCINGIDVLKNFRPWHVFDLDSKTATKDDINTAFRKLAMKYHPDQGGDRRVFEVLQNMRDSILAFR